MQGALWASMFSVRGEWVVIIILRTSIQAVLYGHRGRLSAHRRLNVYAVCVYVSVRAGALSLWGGVHLAGPPTA